VHEVAVLGGDAAERRIGSIERAVDARDDSLDLRAGAVDGGERLDERVGTLAPVGRCNRSGTYKRETKFSRWDV